MIIEEVNKLKKIAYGLCILSVFLLLGCTTGKYKEGVYEKTAVDNYNNEENTASAKITVNDKGEITEVYLDTTYTKNGVKTTKKALGDDYDMKKYNDKAAGEWYEQVEKLEQAVVKNQGITFITLDDEGYTDSVSGCTIKIDALYKALDLALKDAKK